MKFLTDIRLLASAVWLGAAIFFVAVAQSSFAVIPQRELAGAVVNRTLSILNFSGLAIFAVLLFVSFIASSRINRILLWIERIALSMVVAACAVGQFVFGFWISMKRAEIGRPIDELAVDDPLRIQFNMLHEYSVWALIIGMGAALVAFLVIANQKTSPKGVSSSDPYNFEKEFKI